MECPAVDMTSSVPLCDGAVPTVVEGGAKVSLAGCICRSRLSSAVFSRRKMSAVDCSAAICARALAMPESAPAALAGVAASCFLSNAFSARKASSDLSLACNSWLFFANASARLVCSASFWFTSSKAFCFVSTHPIRLRQPSACSSATPRRGASRFVSSATEFAPAPAQGRPRPPPPGAWSKPPSAVPEATGCPPANCPPAPGARPVATAKPHQARERWKPARRLFGGGVFVSKTCPVSPLIFWAR